MRSCSNAGAGRLTMPIACDRCRRARGRRAGDRRLRRTYARRKPALIAVNKPTTGAPRGVVEFHQLGFEPVLGSPRNWHGHGAARRDWRTPAWKAPPGPDEGTVAGERD